MGLLDNLLGKKEETPAAPKGSPFSLSTSLRPVRLNARRENSLDLLIDLQNITNAPQMCSVVVELPKSLGFDNVGLHKTRELRLGALEANVKKQVPVGIFANNQTPPGNYRLTITLNAHYRDYSHVINSVSKAVEIRVV